MTHSVGVTDLPQSSSLVAARTECRNADDLHLWRFPLPKAKRTSRRQERLTRMAAQADRLTALAVNPFASSDERETLRKEAMQAGGELRHARRWTGDR